MALIYFRFIDKKKINEDTGEPWTINDVPESWRAKVQQLLEARK